MVINGLAANFFPENTFLRETIVVITSLFYLIILQFFRVPKRHTVLNPKHIIAPADGKVVVIEETVETESFLFILTTTFSPFFLACINFSN
jgi:phosphatidylserine decarboxylase